ncbi:hypothetical protein B0H19DRAFT_1385185 [Mycena capillaripes]|nr:hypothetical protein B0H19DRAFT_1385185 [Mycena capillaripes]
MLSSVLNIGALLVGGIDAANDWNVPCVTGSCSYDLPVTNNSPSVTLPCIQWGSTDAITDITSAAGWQIIGCNSTVLSQDIRLVCTTGSDRDPNSLCSHLYQSTGAVNKLVRLPEDCGASPFARISKSWIPADQSIPAHVRRMFRRDGPAPVVKALSIDTNFDQVDYSKTGIVNIAIQGANVPGAPTDMEAPTGSRRRTGARPRGFGDFVKGSLSSVTKGIKSAASGVTGTAKAATSKVKSVASKAAGAADNAAAKAESAGKAAVTKAASAAKGAAKKVASKAEGVATKVEGAAKGVATKAAGKAKAVATKAEGAAKGVVTKVASEAKGVVTKAESAAKGVATKVASEAKGVATEVEGAAKAAATKVAAAAKVAAADAEAAAKSIANNTIDINKSIDLQPLVLDKKITLFDKSIECGPVSASLNVDMDANANAQVTLSIAAAGTIVPPKITSFGAVAGMTADVSGTVTMTADATGSLGTGKITLLNLGIPGLDFPGILTIGPSFQVAAELDGEVDVTMDMTMGINFNVNDAQLAFPPSDSNKPLASAFSIGDTPLTLNAAPDVKATGKVTAHLIPSLDLGISALGGKAEAQVSLALDTNAALTLSLEGSASASLKKNIPIAGGDSATKASVKPPPFGGCVGVDGNINVNVGADASFFGLFDALNTEKVLFNKDFEIFKKCFGDATAAAGDNSESRRSERRFVRSSLDSRAALACPINGSKKSSITEGTVKASTID